MTTTILLFSGAVLIAFEIAGGFSHLPGYVLLLIFHIFQFLVEKVDKHVRSINKKIRIALNILMVIIMSPIIISTFILSIVVVILWIIGQILMLVDKILNNNYRNEIKRLTKQQPKRVLGTIKFFLPKMKDEEIFTAIAKIKVPFVAFIGLVLLIIGFILEIISQN